MAYGERLKPFYEFGDGKHYKTLSAAKRAAKTAMKRLGWTEVNIIKTDPMYGSVASYPVKSNPRQLPRRVRKALSKYVSKQIKLPSKFTPAQVRVNDKGEVQIKMNPAKLGSGGRFAKCVKSVEARGGAYDPNAVCAAAGIRKYGKKRMEKMAQKGRRRAR